MLTALDEEVYPDKFKDISKIVKSIESLYERVQDEYNSVISLRYRENKSWKAIAEELNITDCKAILMKNKLSNKFFIN